MLEQTFSTSFQLAYVSLSHGQSLNKKSLIFGPFR